MVGWGFQPGDPDMKVLVGISCENGSGHIRTSSEAVTITEASDFGPDLGRSLSTSQG